jgi:hypothetical protein
MTNPIPIVRKINYTGTRRVITASFNGTLTIYAWGGGGGGGGNDAKTQGGEGAPGLFSSITIDFVKGDVIEVNVGAGGFSGSNGRTTPGGQPGASRLSLLGDSTSSFNGGQGGTAGGSGSSGSGGGGGGATVVSKNGSVVLVAGGGGGGGGAGNDGNTAANVERRRATALNNATGVWFPGTLALNIENSSTFEASSYVTINNYTAFTNLAPPPTSTNKVCVFGVGSIPSGSNNRTIATKDKVNLSSSTVLSFYVNRGTESDWGQKPDTNEQLYIEYSGNGANWVVIDTVPITIKANTWTVRSVTIPQGAKGVNGVFLRFRQNTTGDSAAKRDTWAFTSLWNGSPVLDFRGEAGQTRSGDGGGGGGGGGGYPGGQGGTTPGGDSSAYAGQCGGNFPVEDANYLSGPLFARGGVGAWSSFMNTYAVWPTSSYTVGTFTVYRMFTAPFNGTYKFRFAADNSGALYVNDKLLTNASGFNTAPPLVSLNLDAGTHRLKIVATNTGGPDGFALTIEDSSGGLIWDTRSYLDVYPPGKDNPYYQPGTALGGQVSGNGSNGFAALVFNPIAEYKASSAVKIAGNWKQVTNSYVKVSGEWKNILKTYVKVNGTWRPVESAADLSLAEFTSVSDNFGVSARTFS